MSAGQKLYGDVTLDSLKSKASLATDSTGKIIEGSGGTETDPLSIHLNGDNSCSYAGSVSRDANGRITSFVRTGGLTFTPTRDVNNRISSITDGTKTWTFTRTSNRITSWAVA